MILLSLACTTTNYEAMPIADRRAKVSEIRIELEVFPEIIPITDTKQHRLRRSLLNQFGEAIPTEDITYDKISCREAYAIQNVVIRDMRQSDPDVPESAIESNERYAKAERIRAECRENMPTPTAVPIQIRVRAEQLADDYATGEVAADQKYKNKYAQIDGVVYEVDTGFKMPISDGTSVTVLAYVLIHPEIPCFVDDIDGLTSLAQGDQVTVEGRIMGYRMLQIEGEDLARIIDILSCSIKLR